MDNGLISVVLDWVMLLGPSNVVAVAVYNQAMLHRVARTVETTHEKGNKE